MTTVQDAVDRARREAIPERLAKGLGVMTRLWRQDERCVDGWSLRCTCLVLTDFCEAKRRWAALLADLAQADVEVFRLCRDIDPASPFAVLEFSGLRALQGADLGVWIRGPEDQPPILFGGPRGTKWATWPQLWNAERRPMRDAWEAVVKVQQQFGVTWKETA